MGKYIEKVSEAREALRKGLILLVEAEGLVTVTTLSGDHEGERAKKIIADITFDTLTSMRSLDAIMTVVEKED